MADKPLNYIQIAVEMAHHPKTLHLARIRKWEQWKAFLYLVNLYVQTARYAPYGRLAVTRAQQLAEAAAHESGIPERERENLVDALTKTGHFDPVGEGFEVHGWMEYVGHALRERDRKRRGTSAEPPRNQRADSAEPAWSLQEKAGASAPSERSEEKSRTPQSPPTGGASGATGPTPGLSQAAAPAAAQDAMRSGWLDFLAAWPPEFMVGAEAAEAAFQQRVAAGEAPARLVAAAKHYHPWCAAQGRRPKDPVRFLTPVRGASDAPYLEFVTPKPIPSQLNGAGASGRRNRFDPDKDY